MIRRVRKNSPYAGAAVRDKKPVFEVLVATSDGNSVRLTLNGE